MSILKKIVAAKEEEVKELNTYALEAPLPLTKNTFISAITKRSVNLIGEIKPKSPSSGFLSSPSQINSCIDAYNKNASAISVLTDKRFFNGGYDLLSKVAIESRLPLLQKDFVIDEKQIKLGLKHGASAVLLIKKILSDQRLNELSAFCQSINLVPVVEINQESELESAINCGAKVILINNRNLDTLEVNLDTTKTIAPLIPKNLTVISASGYQNFKEIERMSKFVNVFLIGTSLMKAEDPQAKLRQLLGLNTMARVAG